VKNAEYVSFAFFRDSFGLVDPPSSHRWTCCMIGNRLADLAFGINRHPCDRYIPEKNGSPHWTISGTVNLGRRPAKSDENLRAVRIAPVGAVRSSLTSGAIEAEQLFDPERA
jgi:hypothetical protein